MDMSALKAEIERDEGFVSEAYTDSLGYLTIGIGRLVDKRRGGGISKDEAYILLENDIKRIVIAFDIHFPWWVNLSDARQRALINMAFQLGVSGLQKFKKMLAALEEGKYQEACREGLDSKWAKSDSPERANRITKMILDG